MLSELSPHVSMAALLIIFGILPGCGGPPKPEPYEESGQAYKACVMKAPNIRQCEALKAVFLADIEAARLKAMRNANSVAQMNALLQYSATIQATTTPQNVYVYRGW